MPSENRKENTGLLKTERSRMGIFSALNDIFVSQFPSRLFAVHFAVLQETLQKKSYLRVIWKATIEGV